MHLWDNIYTYVSHSKISFSHSNISLIAKVLTWLRDVNTSTHDVRILFHSPPLCPLWQASIWTDCTFPPGSGPVGLACERTGWAANNSTINNEQEFCAEVKTRRGTARHTNRGDDGRPEVLPVQDELALVFDLDVLDEFAQVLLRRPWFKKIRRQRWKIKMVPWELWITFLQ